jgi:hypothetical protein
MGAVSEAIPHVRYRIFVVGTAALVGILIQTSQMTVLADFGGSGPTVGCTASDDQVSFAGTCIDVAGPTAPTVPAASHHWSTQAPTSPPGCTPYTVTEWATGTSAVGWSSDGTFWTKSGQRVPILYSTPLEDNGWVWYVPCDSSGSVSYMGMAQLPRQPSPCAPGTVAAACEPGYDPSGFLAAVKKQIPTEQITAVPPAQGVVGVPVMVALQPVPQVEQAVLDVNAPDLGDGDLGEQIHVVWVVRASPEDVIWTWPDATQSAVTRWVPQVEENGQPIVGAVTYLVTAAGFWSDGLSVHQLPSLTVGTIPVTTQLPYSVQQVQPDLG